MTSECRWKHGAVAVKGPRVIAWSPNIYRNDSRINYREATWHAEEAVIRELQRLKSATYGTGHFKDYTLYVARVNKAGDLRESRPCKSCFDLLSYYGICNIYYTNSLEGFSRETLM